RRGGASASVRRTRTNVVVALSMAGTLPLARGRRNGARLRRVGPPAKNGEVRVRRIGFVVAVALACKASPSSAKPPAEKPAKDAAPAPKGKSPATKLDDAQITTFLAQAPAKSGTKRTVVREQAFAINKGQEDERWFVPALEERAGTVAYAHYEGKPGSAPRRFEDDSWPVDAVAAVAFDDVDVDGQRDVEVILSVHRLNAARFNVARIFRAGAGGALTLDWQLTDRANYGKPLPGMAEVRRRLAAKRDVALPAPPKEAAAGP